MTQTIEAICENGALRPVNPDTLAGLEGRRVTLIVRDEAAPDPVELLGEVYDGLSEDEISEIERITLDRSHLFRPRNLD